MKQVKQSEGHELENKMLHLGALLHDLDMNFCCQCIHQFHMFKNIKGNNVGKILVKYGCNFFIYCGVLKIR